MMAKKAKATKKRKTPTKRVSSSSRKTTAVAHSPAHNHPNWWQPKGKLITRLLARELDALGFRALLQGVKRTSPTLLIRIEHGIVYEVSLRDVKRALEAVLDAIPDCVPAAYEDVARLSNAEVDRLTDQLPLLALRKGIAGTSVFTPATDMQDRASFCFTNGVVTVTKDDIALHPTSEHGAHGLIWEQEVVQRDYAHPPEGKGLYETFVERAFFRRVKTGSAQWTDDFAMNDEGQQHYRAFRACVGYLLHSFRDPANPKAIIFVDADSDSTQAQGGTGKSMVAKSLNHLRALASQDGKRFADSMGGGSGRFQFSNVKADTKIICIDDVRPEFKFEYLFTMLTGDMEVEQKGKDKIVIPSERVPKFVITTNYVLPQSGASFKRRQYLVEFGGYWSEAVRRGEQVSDPQHLGCLLFDGFDATEWNRFYRYLLGCVQQFLKEGVVLPPSAPLQLKALRRELGDAFMDWSEAFFEGYAARAVPKDKGEYLDELKDAFATKYPTAPPIDSFPTHIKKAAEFFGWEYNAHKAAQGSTPTHRRWRISDATGDKRDAVIFTPKA